MGFFQSVDEIIQPEDDRKRRKPGFLSYGDVGAGGAMGSPVNDVGGSLLTANQIPSSGGGNNRSRYYDTNANMWRYNDTNEPVFAAPQPNGAKTPAPIK